MIHYTQCPVCKSNNIKAVFSAKDHTVSQEDFAVWKCDDCTLMFTQDVPGQEAMGKYYESENYISHSDTQQGFINKLYHRIRKITLGVKRKLVVHETGLTSGNLLDVGCGTGAFLHAMKEAGWQITGLEPDEAAREKANSLYHIQPRPSQEIFTLPLGSFDAISMWHVLEHVHQLHEYIQQLKNLLTSKGKLFIAVPNYTSADAAAYKEHWAAYDVPRHLYHFSPRSMKTLMNIHGMKVKKIKGMWFDSFYVSMLSETYRNRKGNMLKAFFAGLRSNMKAMLNKERCSSVIYVIEKK